MGCVILIHIVGCVPPRQDVEINSKFCDTVCVAALSFGELLRGVINVAANELAAVARGEVMMIPASLVLPLLPAEIANFEIEIGAEEKGRIHRRKFLCCIIFLLPVCHLTCTGKCGMCGFK